MFTLEASLEKRLELLAYLENLLSSEMPKLPTDSDATPEQIRYAKGKLEYYSHCLQKKFEELALRGVAISDSRWPEDAPKYDFTKDEYGDKPTKTNK